MRNGKTRIFAGAGVRVYWMGAPSTATTEEPVFAGVRHGYEAESGRLTFATPPVPRPDAKKIAGR